LILELELLIDGRSDVFDYSAMLPSSLKHLTLATNAYTLHNSRLSFEEGPDNEDEDADADNLTATRRASWVFILDPTPGIGLETFTLEIYTNEHDRDGHLVMDERRSVQPDDDMRQRLRDIISNTAKRGLAYNAIEYEVDFEQRQKRWVKTIAGRTSAQEEGTCAIAHTP
jgi:hypothetical protein